MENCFCGVNARRRSTAVQVQHLNERCSYPGALMIFAGTIFSKRIVAPHTTQRIATTQPEHWKPMETLGRPSCQADAMRLRKRVALAPHAAMSAAATSSTTKRYCRPCSSLAQAL